MAKLLKDLESEIEEAINIARPTAIKCGIKDEQLRQMVEYFAIMRGGGKMGNDIYVCPNCVGKVIVAYNPICTCSCKCGTDMLKVVENGQVVSSKYENQVKELKSHLTKLEDENRNLKRDYERCKANCINVEDENINLKDQIKGLKISIKNIAAQL